MDQSYSVTILGYTHEGLTVSHNLIDTDWPIDQIARILRIPYIKIVHLSILSIADGSVLFLEESPIA